MRTTKIRHQFLLELGLSEKLESLSRKPGTTKSDIISKAVEAFIERRNEGDFDQRYGKRFDKMTRDLINTKRDVEMILESLVLFIRYTVSLYAHMPYPDKEAQAVGQKRFHDFIDDVGRQIASKKVSLGTEDNKEAA